MKITTDRTQLDATLRDTDCTILILFGADGSKSAVVYDSATKAITETFRKVLLVQNPAVLIPQEQADWYSGDNSYVTLSKSRVVVKKGEISQLCFASGNPEPRKIRNTFSIADQA